MSAKHKVWTAGDALVRVVLTVSLSVALLSSGLILSPASPGASVFWDDRHDPLYCCDYPWGSPGDGQDMASDGRTPAGHSCSLMQPLLCLQTDTSGRRLPGSQSSRPAIGVSRMRADAGFLVATSASLVSSRLGRQFTLVGAKPSGTS